MNARAGEFIRTLTRHASAIADGMKSFEETQSEILAEIAACNAALQHLRRASSGKTKTLTSEAIRRISAYRGGRTLFGDRPGRQGRDQLHQIYQCLLELVGDLKHTEADRRWRI